MRCCTNSEEGGIWRNQTCERQASIGTGKEERLEQEAGSGHGRDAALVRGTKKTSLKRHAKITVIPIPNERTTSYTYSST